MVKRSAFTLIEVMIVLTIVVGVMAIAWPRMRRMAAKTQIREAAIEFKAACVEARDQSVRLGKPIYLRYHYGHSEFLLSELEQIDLESSDTIKIEPQESADRRDDIDQPYSARFELALGIVFDDPAIERHLDDSTFDNDPLAELNRLTDRDPLAEVDTLGLDRESSIDWNQAQRITFYPEGRSTSAAVRVLAPDTGDSIMLSVRGLTAAVEIGDLEKPLKRPGKQTDSTPFPHQPDRIQPRANIDAN